MYPCVVCISRTYTVYIFFKKLPMPYKADVILLVLTKKCNLHIQKRGIDHLWYCTEHQAQHLLKFASSPKGRTSSHKVNPRFQDVGHVKKTIKTVLRKCLPGTSQILRNCKIHFQSTSIVESVSKVIGRNYMETKKNIK